MDAAKKERLRYVHVPIGYNGVPQERVLQIAKAMNELPGPFNIHCHHGKHRGPAAAAVAMLCADDKCSVTDALKLLKAAGTDPRYKGLFESVEKLSRPTKDDLKKALPLAEAERVAGITQAMVAIDHHFDHLKLARKAGWRSPKDHPDIDPPHEALQLLEQIKELRRQPATAKRPADFQKWLEDTEVAAKAIEKLLRQAKTEKTVSDEVGRHFTRASAICAACHAKYRD